MNWLIKKWYNKHPLRFLLWPFALVYGLAIFFRFKLYQLGFYKKFRSNVPIIVVGNLTLGGTGKTPLVIWIANYLKQQGYTPGIVSRGYGGYASSYPQRVTSTSDPAIVSDEAVLLVNATQCPMRVAPERVAAVKSLLAETDCNIIISDDGLQHYAMERDIEIVVLDGQRRLGNGMFLPAGPLRESKKRLKKVDFIVTNGAAKAGEYAMYLQPQAIYNLTNSNQTLQPQDYVGKNIHAIAAIGHPERFFNTLKGLGLTFTAHSFPDHYLFSATDLTFEKDAIIVMTEKDAIKCRRFAKPNFWYLPVIAQLDNQFGPALLQKL